MQGVQELLELMSLSLLRLGSCLLMQSLIKDHRACSERLCQYLPEWWRLGDKP